jgi:hypothetical protein
MRTPIHELAARVLLGAALLLPTAAAAEGTRDLSLGALEDGGSCPVTQEQSEERAQMMARLEARLRAEMGAAGEDVIPLDGRGYRYESDRVPSIARELRILEIEMQRARAAARAQDQKGPAQ